MNGNYVLALDSIPFFGGSKVASAAFLDVLMQHSPEQKLVVCSSDRSAWREAELIRHHLIECEYLQKQEQGLRYFLRHALIFLQLLFQVILYGKPSLLVGTSGPGNDLALSALSTVLNVPLLQLIHGPVATSRTLAKALNRARHVVYLPSTLASIARCLGRSTTELTTDARFTPMINGLSQRAWPKPTQASFKRARLFWAASLLKWKGLELFLDALNQATELSPFATIKRVQSEPPSIQASVCYIRPRASAHACSQPPANTAGLRAYESPGNLDELRAEANIFISTALNEPFGLSILEALAAGLCVVIPADGAYWDQHLYNGKHCLKYRAGDVDDLAKVIMQLHNNMSLAEHIAAQGKLLAQNYRAEKTYRQIVLNVSQARAKKAEGSTKYES